jgi:hypothetical protein
MGGGDATRQTKPKREFRLLLQPHGKTAIRMPVQRFWAWRQKTPTGHDRIGAHGQL